MYEKAKAEIYPTPALRWDPLGRKVYDMANRPAEQGFLCIVTPATPAAFEYDWYLVDPLDGFVLEGEGSYIRLRVREGFTGSARAALWCVVRDEYGLEAKTEAATLAIDTDLPAFTPDAPTTENA